MGSKITADNLRVHIPLARYDMLSQVEIQQDTMWVYSNNYKKLVDITAVSSVKFSSVEFRCVKSWVPK